MTGAPGGKDHDEGVLVEIGSFRVDREKMLEVLSRYQFQSPDLALRELVRCAVAAGAQSAHISPADGPQGRGFEFTFGGKPFTVEELSDPWSPVLSGGQSPGKHLAAALLALSRTGPALLTVSSGGNTVSCASLASCAAAPGGASEHTALKALWEKEPDDLPLSRILGFPEEAEEALVCCPIPVSSPSASGSTFHKLKSAGRERSFREEGRYGFVAARTAGGPSQVTVAPPPAAAELDVYSLGVYVETVTARLPVVPVSADINDDALALDASFGKCVRDENFSALLAFAERQAGEQLLLEIELQRGLISRTGRELAAGGKAVSLWRGCLGYLEDWQVAAASSKVKAFFSDLLRSLTARDERLADPLVPKGNHPYYDIALRAGWLQDACRRLKASGGLFSDSPAAQALRKAPVLLSVMGRPLSAEDILKLAAGGGLGVSRSGCREGARTEAVWLVSLREEVFLECLVPRESWTWRNS